MEQVYPVIAVTTVKERNSNDPQAFSTLFFLTNDAIAVDSAVH
jgi:hypothetical protein